MRVAAIDQGTTGTKGFRLSQDGEFSQVHASEHRQIYPRAEWVEHDPEELLSHVRDAVAAAGQVDAIGIDNQGETVIAWDARTGRAIYNAIVWQDSRTSDAVARLKAEGAEDLTLARAGLPLDPYFSASKMRWIIDNVDEARTLHAAKRLRLGTSDAFFLDRLTGNFATDVTTASRTSLMSLDSFTWDHDLCRLFGVPIECLPDIRSTTGTFGMMGKTPVTASLVDQQAALFGHGCEKPGNCKITFGTGAFALAVAGPKRVDGRRLGVLPTVAWKMQNDSPRFALEGGVYNAASALNWARSLGLFGEFSEIAAFAAPPAIGRGLVFVPALSGLGCPHWDRSASGLWLGLGLETSKSDMVQSLLEGIALRAAEIIEAMGKLVDIGGRISADGGMARNEYFLQFLANILGKEIAVPSTPDLTAMGTARLAMLGAGARSLPPLPPPQRLVVPEHYPRDEQRALFAEAVRRSQGWKR